MRDVDRSRHRAGGPIGRALASIASHHRQDVVEYPIKKSVLSETRITNSL